MCVCVCVCVCVTDCVCACVSVRVCVFVYFLKYLLLYCRCVFQGASYFLCLLSKMLLQCVCVCVCVCDALPPMFVCVTLY